MWMCTKKGLYGLSQNVRHYSFIPKPEEEEKWPGSSIHACMCLICELHRYTSLQSRPQNLMRTNRFTVCILIIVTMHSNPTATEELALLIEW